MTVWGHRWGGKAAKPDPTDPVVEEALALLGGQCIERFTATGRRVPRWAWLNAVAHARVEDLHGLAVAGRLADPGSWAAAIGRLAADLLNAAHTDEELARLQAELVVPLELDVLADRHRLPVRPMDVDRLLAGRLAPRDLPGPDS